ncbi:MAG: TolC family protein [Bacteroidales bacterium]|nr:TolC family protein [Bacteroidales bacterium]
MRHNNLHISIILGLILALSAKVTAQPHYSQVLNYAEKNNPTILLAAKHAEAEKVVAHIGSLLPNPQADAAYFWGDPTNIGIRWDLSISQSFEMPSVLVRRTRLRDLQEHAAELNYEVVRKSVLLEIQQLCADWIYYHAVARIYSRRCASATQLAQLFQTRFAAGDCSILEYNRAQMYMADIQNQAAEAYLKEDHAAHDLHILLGSDDFTFYQSEYDPVTIAPSFEDWYEQLEMRNPDLRMLDNQLETRQQQLQLSRAQWLPSMSVGYASENRVGETFRGIKVGLELPLWSQQRAVRAARLEAEAAQQELSSQRAMLFNHLRCMFHRHAALIHNVENLKNALQQYNSQDHLDKALEAGEISLEQYLQQSDFYLDMELQLWETSHELEQLHLYLYSIEL